MFLLSENPFYLIKYFFRRFFNSFGLINLSFNIAFTLSSDVWLNKSIPNKLI